MFASSSFCAAVRPEGPSPLEPASGSRTETVSCEGCGGADCLSAFCQDGKCVQDVTVTQWESEGWTVSVPTQCTSGSKYRCTANERDRVFSCELIAEDPSSGSTRSASSSLPGPSSRPSKARLAQAMREMNAGATDEQIRDAETDAAAARVVAVESAEPPPVPPAPPPLPSPPPLYVDSSLPAWEQRRLLRAIERDTKETRREARNRFRMQVMCRGDV